eukprot:7082870-Pyramimonas_sp.AAC.1
MGPPGDASGAAPGALGREAQRRCEKSARPQRFHVPVTFCSPKQARGAHWKPSQSEKLVSAA